MTDGMPRLPTTIVEAAAWLRSGRVNAIALTEAFMARARATQDTIGAFISFSEDAAVAAARRADADFERGVDNGPLQGIPVGFKDIMATEDAPTTANSRVLDPAWGNRPDATVVRRLRAAGAVSLGKLGLHEYANSWPDPSTGFRIVRNPWDLTRTPGGSSTGTGAAVAAGLILGGLGTDTGGSIRGPASYCGISGIKPTFGRVSKEGCVPLSFSLDCIGPMAPTAIDCALMLQVIAGHDLADPCSVDVPVQNMIERCDGSLANIRIGLPREFFFTLPDLDSEVVAAVLVAIDHMATAGAQIVELVLPLASEASDAYTVILRSEAFAYHEPDLQARPQLYGKYTRRLFQLGAFFTGADYVQAQRVRSLVKRAWAVAMTSVDVIVVPTMPSTAATFEGYDPDARVGSPSLMAVFSVTGLPALSIPCGFSAAGLPIGMQIVGKPFDEPTVFKVGDAYQRITSWHATVPNWIQEVTSP